MRYVLSLPRRSWPSFSAEAMMIDVQTRRVCGGRMKTGQSVTADKPKSKSSSPDHNLLSYPVEWSDLQGRELLISTEVGCNMINRGFSACQPPTCPPYECSSSPGPSAVRRSPSDK